MFHNTYVAVRKRIRKFFIPNPPRVKNWTELKEEVERVHEWLYWLWSLDLDYRLPPHAFVFRTIKTPVPSTRIYFVSSPRGSNNNKSLYAIDVPRYAPTMNPAEAPRIVYPWIPVLSSFQGSDPPSNEEQLPMERQRRTLTAVPSAFKLHEKSAKLLFTASSLLFECIDNCSVEPLTPTEVETPHSSGARLNAEICPNNSDLIAYVNNRDIFVANSASGFEVQLTHTAHGFGSKFVSAGKPSYVMQEEFNRSNGFWWQPISYDGLYRILYEEVDESEVNVVNLLSLPGQEEEVHRYPRAGTPNAKSTLRLLQFDVVEGEIRDVVEYEPEHNVQEFFGWAEYIVRAGWTPDGRFIFAELLNREQQKLELVLFPALPCRLKRKSDPSVPGPSAPAYVIYSESTDVWINVNDLLVFLPCDDPDAVHFLWASQETGFRHIYSIKSTMRPCIGSNWNWNEKPVIPLTPTVLEKVQLTWGDWEVLNEPLSINHSLGLMFFTGLCDTPIEQHLYVTSFRLPSEPRRLTNLGFSYEACLNSETTLAILSYSALQAPPACQLFRIQYKGEPTTGACHLTDVSLEPITHFEFPVQPDKSLGMPEICSHRLGSGEKIFSMIFKPINFNPTKKYPTILHVYGGPVLQTVDNSFKGTSHLWTHLLASQGYCVINIDSRGSNRRGVRFESHIRHKMGTVELNDQVDILKLLANENSFIDMERVGIFGWSYGGYLSLMGLAQYPDVFKVCVAGGPVTSWDLYDTGYTERYMGLPQTNPEAYRQSSVLTYIPQFPDEENRLFIIHGLVDDNVLFTHTVS